MFPPTNTANTTGLIPCMYIHSRKLLALSIPARHTDRSERQCHHCLSLCQDSLESLLPDFLALRQD